MHKAILNYKFGDIVKQVVVQLNFDIKNFEMKKCELMVFQTIEDKGLLIKFDDFVSLEDY